MTELTAIPKVYVEKLIVKWIVCNLLFVVILYKYVSE